MTNLSDQVLTSLHDAIVLGRHPIDQPIRQDAVATEFGISKIPVREAMNRLEQEGLLVSHPNRGFLLKRYTDAEALEIMTIRRELEVSLLTESLDRSDDEMICKAHAEAQEIGEAFDPEKTEPGWPGAFILALTHRGSLSFTRNLVSRLWSLSEYIVRSPLNAAGIARAVAYRSSLLEAWRTGSRTRLAQAAIEGLEIERSAILAGRFQSPSAVVTLPPS